MNDHHFRELISGITRGPVASVARAALHGLSYFYGVAAGLQRMAYDSGWKQARRVPVPVISVGNITAGGTGKTPFVAHLAQRLRDSGVRVGLVSRGYRTHCELGNDEKLVLDQLCPNVPHLQNKDRHKAARAAVEQHGCQLLILDDGFQHRRLARDLDIVLIDTLNPWGFGNLLPRGLLREPVDSLSRADLVVMTRVDQSEEAEVQAIRTVLSKHVPLDRCLSVVYRPQRLINSRQEQTPIDSLQGSKVLAFCGIGNPISFRKSVASTGMLVAAFQAFPDHHKYRPQDLRALQQKAQSNQVSAIVTTHKDLVKLDATHFDIYPLWALDIAAEIQSGQTSLEAQLDRVLLLTGGMTSSSPGNDSDQQIRAA